jgi:predicted AAA+ superfamily ATPase
MYIHQYLLDVFKANIPTDHKAVIVFGPRRCGKTTLIKKFLADKSDYLLVDGEDINVQNFLSSQSVEKLAAFIGKNKLLVIDEAQKIPNIGVNLKLIIDHILNVQIIATGSSAFDLGNQIGEPLTGRKITFNMYPLSQLELMSIENRAQVAANLENRLVFGSYPEVILQNDNQQRQIYLRELISAYLYKDILVLEGIKKSNKIIQLLQLLAHQIGKEVSMTELGAQLGLNKATVDKYLDLLEKTFVIFRLTGLSRNLRKEIVKKPRYYFYDLGVRNAIINQFNPLMLRNDVGELWENYVIIERLKKQAYQQILSNNYFWRTYDQQEIDWIEEREGKLFGYEIKWNPKTKVKPPKDFIHTYSNAIFEVINQDNYLDFIC